jgi:hypothetical protein
MKFKIHIVIVIQLESGYLKPWMPRLMMMAASDVWILLIPGFVY